MAPYKLFSVLIVNNNKTKRHNLQMRYQNMFTHALHDYAVPMFSVFLRFSQKNAIDTNEK